MFTYIIQYTILIIYNCAASFLVNFDEKITMMHKILLKYSTDSSLHPSIIDTYLCYQTGIFNSSIMVQWC